MMNTTANQKADCGCSQPARGAAALSRRNLSEQEPKLQDLIPIAVVIAAGCEPCAQRMVKRALAQGCSKAQIAKVLGIVGHMQKLDCLIESVGGEIPARMEAPLAAARRTLSGRGMCA